MKLACKDLSPNTDCTFEVEGATAEEAARKMVPHAKSDHAADVAGMSDEAMVAAFAPKAHE
jgi:predicted small metal-binding protein